MIYFRQAGEKDLSEFGKTRKQTKNPVAKRHVAGRHDGVCNNRRLKIGCFIFRVVELHELSSTRPRSLQVSGSRVRG